MRGLGQVAAPGEVIYVAAYLVVDISLFPGAMVGKNLDVIRPVGR